MRKALELLGRLSDIDVDWLIGVGVHRYLDAGTVLIEEGGTVDFLYILLDGELRVTAGHQSRPIATLLSGEIIGEISFVDSRPRSATVKASRDSHVLSISRHLLDKQLTEDTAFAARFYFALATLLAARLRNTNDRLGYVDPSPENDPDELDDSAMDEITMAASHFTMVLQRLRGGAVMKATG